MVETSTEVKELFAALAGFQAEAEAPVKNAVNQHFGNAFADLRTVLAAVKPTLIKFGLVLVQLPVTTDKGIGLCTQVCHAPSGQWIRATAAYPVQSANPQAAASAITYARRYGIMAALGLAAEDDDAEAAMGRETRMIARDGSPIVDVSPKHEHAPRADDEQRMTRSKARALVRAAGHRTLEDIGNAPMPAQPQPQPEQPKRASVHPLRKAKANPTFPNAGRPVANPRAVTAYNEVANTIHAVTSVKLTGDLDDYGMLIPPGAPPTFTEGDMRGRSYAHASIDLLREMAASSSFRASAPPIKKLWVAYLVARIDAQVRAAQP